jgi:hypothetical protein
MGVVPFLGFSLLVHFSQAFWAVWETSKLAAPQCVAGFRVRLDLHGRAPFLGFSLLVHFSQAFWAVWETSKLAAPQCVAGFRVRLDLHGRAPFFRNLLGILRCCCQAP